LVQNIYDKNRDHGCYSWHKPLSTEARLVYYDDWYFSLIPLVLYDKILLLSVPLLLLVYWKRKTFTITHMSWKILFIQPEFSFPCSQNTVPKISCLHSEETSHQALIFTGSLPAVINDVTHDDGL